MKAKAILIEAIEHSPSLINNTQLLPVEAQWLDHFEPNHNHRSGPTHSLTEDWEIRLDETAFFNWTTSLKEICLFFDGASKGNPGRAGGGGVIFSTDGITVCKYAWGIGIESNNTAEFCGLWQGLRIAQSKGFTKKVVFGDSRLLLQSLIKKNPPSQLNLGLMYQKIERLTTRFESIKNFHVLRGLNALADGEANKACLLSRGSLQIDGSVSRCDVP